MPSTDLTGAHVLQFPDGSLRAYTFAASELHDGAWVVEPVHGGQADPPPAVAELETAALVDELQTRLDGDDVEERLVERVRELPGVADEPPPAA